MAVQKKANGVVVLGPNLNRPKFSNAKKEYYKVWMDAAGDISSDCCLLFTPEDFSRDREVLIPWIGETKGRLYPVQDVATKRTVYYVKLSIDGVIKIYRLSATTIRAAIKRAERNPEDLLPRGFWSDLWNRLK